jgi:hypothetical protein
MLAATHPMAPLTLEGIADRLLPKLVSTLLAAPSPEQTRTIAEDVRRQIPASRDREVWQGRYRTEAATAHFASDPAGGPDGIGTTARDLDDLHQFLLRGIVGAGVLAARTPDLAIDLPLILLLASGYGFAAPGPASQDHHFRRIQVLDGTGRRQLRGLARPDVEAEGSEDWEAAQLPAQLGTPPGQVSLARGLTIRLLKGLREQGKGEGPLIHAAAGANLIIRQVIALLIKAASDYYSQSQLLVNRQLLEGLERRDA